MTEPVWRSRIVGESDVPPDQLLAHPLNARRHPNAQRAALDDSLGTLGWIQRIVVNRRTGHVIDGHARVEEALSRGEPTVPVLEVDLSDDEERLALAVFDPISAMAVYDQDALAALLDGLTVSSDALREMLAGLGAPASAGKTDPDLVPDLPDEPYVQRGEIYELGRHRIMCGSATDETDVRRLMAGFTPALLVTDPPYGVSYDPAWRVDAGLGGNAKKLGAVTNDDQADWTPAWALAPADIAYVWHGGLHAQAVALNLEAVGFVLRGQIIWVKDRMAISRGAYHWRHEPCWYAVRKGRRANWIGGRKQQTVMASVDRTPTHDELLELYAELLGESSVWEIPAREDAGHGHGTQKPVECMERAIRNHRGDVYDPFVGSGTTIIAAERQSRRCFAMELEPKYVQVAIERWEAYTGEKAERVEQ